MESGRGQLHQPQSKPKAEESLRRVRVVNSSSGPTSSGAPNGSDSEDEPRAASEDCRVRPLLAYTAHSKICLLCVFHGFFVVRVLV